MDIGLAALGGGIGGALGALVGYGLSFLLPRRWRTWVVTVCALVLALVGGRVGPLFAPPREDVATTATLEAQLQSSQQLAPLMRAWKQSDATSYQHFLEQLLAAQSSQDRSATVAAARAQLTNAAVPRLARLSDPQIVDFVLLERDTFRDLGRTRPQVCVAMFRGLPFGDMSDAVSASVQQRELSLMVAAFAASPRADAEILQGDALQTAVSQVVDSMRAVVGDDVSMLSANADLSGREARFCEVAATFYDRMGALPQPEAARLMRSLLAASPT